MGTARVSRLANRLGVSCVMIVAMVAGCQMSPLPPQKMVEHRQQQNDSGLTNLVEVVALKSHGAFPVGWTQLKLQKSAMYSHQQWRSPSKRTAVGVTYVRMPLPLNTKMLVWLAMGEVTKRVNDGKMLRQWNDEMGRRWFEAENSKYHMTGYVMTRGFDAWINYCGYRVNEPMDEAEVALGARALNTLLPLAVVEAAEPTTTASAK